MAIIASGGIDADFTGIGDDNADVADFDYGLGDLFNRGEQAIDEIAAFDQNLQLTPAQTTGGQERFRVLEVIVEGPEVGLVLAHGRGNDLIGGQGRAVVHCDDADRVFTVADDNRVKTVALGNDIGHFLEQRGVGIVKLDAVDAVVGDNDELCQVERVGALAQDLALRAFLAAGLQEVARVLEIRRRDIAGKRLCRVQRCAVARKDITDLALRNGHQRLDMQTVLERQEEVKAAAQNGRLETGFAFQRDQAAGDGAFAAPQFFDDGGVVIADVADHARYGEQTEKQHHAQGECCQWQII